MDPPGTALKRNSPVTAFVCARIPEPATGLRLDLPFRQETAHQEMHEPEYTIPIANVSQDINYLPWKNLFFASYFTLTGVHGVHVLGGMIPIFILMSQAIRGKIFAPATEYVGLYWHFVDLVWIFLFPLLYLI